MTSEALAVVQAFFDLVEAEDYARMPDILDPSVVWFGTRGGLDEAQILRGPDAVIGYLHEIQEPWEQFDIDVERLIETGDTVVVFTRETGRARHGGPEIQNDTAAIVKVRQQKIVEMVGYLDREEALRAARLTDRI
jgi:ketosteroid isomerase-like protein